MFIWLTLLFIIERKPYRNSSKAETWRRQQQVQRPFKSVVYLTGLFLVVACSACCIIAPRTTSVVMAKHLMKCSPQQSLVNKYPSGFPVAQFMDAFSQFELLPLR